MKSVSIVFRRLIILAFLLVFSQKICAQVCSEIDITLPFQNDVNQFQSVYGPCDEITGELTIGGHPSEMSDISNLAGLTGLLRLGGILNIHSNPLVDLDELDSLTDIGGLFLTKNPMLENLDGLINITSLASMLEISDVPNLENINGLSNIEFVGGDLSVANAEKLISLEPLSKLTSISNNQVYGGVFLSHLGISDLTGLENITVLNGQLKITFCPNLISLTGFPQTIDSLQSLHLQTNSMLEDISALSNIKEVNGPYPEGNLHISSSNLSRLTGLEQLERVDQGVSIIYNHLLRDCSALRRLFDEIDDGVPGPNLPPIPDVGGTVHFSNNQGTCNSWQGMFDYIFWDGFD